MSLCESSIDFFREFDSRVQIPVIFYQLLRDSIFLISWDKSDDYMFTTPTISTKFICLGYDIHPTVSMSSSDRSILIKGARFIADQGDAVHGDILIEGNRISAISVLGRGSRVSDKTRNPKPDTVIDARNKIAIPGLVNAHTHVSMTLLRGYGDGLPLQRWLTHKVWPIEAKQKPKDIRAAAMLAFCEMIRSGTTSFADMCAHDTKPIFEAARDAGLRGLVSRSMIDHVKESDGKKSYKECSANLSYAKPGDIVLPSVSAHAPYTCSEELLIKSKALARKEGLKFQIHASETRTEIFETLKKRGKYPYEYLDSISLLDRDTLLAHGGWLTKREMDMAGKHSVSVIQCPVSNMKLATGGITQAIELESAGANVCVGTDSACSNNSLDMFQSMKVSALLQKHHYWKADVISSAQTFSYATANGAKALGFDSGALTPGKLADIVLLEYGPNLYPEHSLLSNLVFAAGPQNVSDVIINGKFIMANRTIVAFDEQTVFDDAEKAKHELFRR